MDFRKGIVSVTLGILIAFLFHTIVSVAMVQPEWDCYPEGNKLEGEIPPVDQACEQAYRDSRESFNFYAFIIISTLSIIAIIAGLYVPIKSAAGMSISSGVLLGGLFGLFTGTMRGWSNLAPIAQLIILIVEIAIVIFVAYKKLQNETTQKKSKK